MGDSRSFEEYMDEDLIFSNILSKLQKDKVENIGRSSNGRTSASVVYEAMKYSGTESGPKPLGDNFILWVKLK